MRISVLVEHISRITDWILFVFLLVLASFVLLFPLNLPLFLVVLCMSLFILPKRWVKWEFSWRFCLFLLTGIFLEILLFSLFKGTLGFVYLTVVAVPIVISLFLLSERYKWRVSRFISTETSLVVATFLAAVILLDTLGIWEFKESLIGFSVLLVMLLMLNHTFSAFRRTELFRFLSKFGNFHTPNDFIEEILKKANKKESEEAEFIRYRFNEFLDQIEKGMVEQAYITLATGIMELLGVWAKVKNQLVNKWEDKIKATHDQIRASIVHSTPKEKRKKKQEEKLKKDLQRKRQILNIFKVDPYSPIKDLFKRVADNYGLK